MKHITVLISTFLLLTIFACQKETNQIFGKWKVIDVQDSGQSLAFDMDSIYFEFMENDTFRMTDTYGGKIFGVYQMDPPYLYISTFDKEETKKQPIEILTFTKDSLRLLMNNTGIKRTITLIKK